jgi:YNFM family putative membrane transporter
MEPAVSTTPGQTGSVPGDAALAPYEPSPAMRVLLVACALAVVSLLYLPLPLIARLGRDLGIGEAAAGLISVFGLPYAVGFLLFGMLSDRWGRRTVMVTGLGALTLVTACLAFAHSAPAMFLGRALQGIAAATYPPVIIAYLAERGSPRQRVWSVAWLSTAFLTAGLVGQIYGAAIGGRFGLGTALLPLCVVYALTAWCLWRTPVERSAGRSPLPRWRAFAHLWANPHLRRVYVPAAPLMMCFVAFYVVLDARLGHVWTHEGISPIAVREMALPGFFMPLLVAVLLPRWGAARVVSAGLCVAMAGLLLCAWAGPAHPRALIGASLVFVAGIGVCVPGLIARVSGIAQPALRGLAVGLYTFILFTGASFGPWLAWWTGRWSESGALLFLAGSLAGVALYTLVPAADVRRAS